MWPTLDQNFDGIKEIRKKTREVRRWNGHVEHMYVQTIRVYLSKTVWTLGLLFLKTSEIHNFLRITRL